MDFARALATEDSVATRSGIRYIPPPTSPPKDSNNLDEMVRTAANESILDLLQLRHLLLPQHDGGCTDIDDPVNRRVQKRMNLQHSYKEHFLTRRPTAAAATAAATDKKDGKELLHDDDKKRHTSTSNSHKNTIQEGDLVVILVSFDNLKFTYVKRGEVFAQRYGQFHHDDFIGLPTGCQVRSRNNRGYGFCYLLKPTPELWARSLNHRTQIVQELDQSQIIFQLYLRPGQTVVESGTGSGACSHAILRTLAPTGHLHTYEFNAKRAETARIEFQKNGVGHLVTVHHRDVCGKQAHGQKKALPPQDNGNENENSERKEGSEANSSAGGAAAAAADSRDCAGGGFDLPAASVDAVFLDLPEPWLAVPHAAVILKPNGRIASYSPCVEQTQRVCAALAAAQFHSITTMEYRLQEHYVDSVEYEGPPTEKRIRLEHHNPITEAAMAALQQQRQQEKQQSKDVKETGTQQVGGGTMSAGEDTGAEADNETSEVSETEALPTVVDATTTMTTTHAPNKEETTTTTSLDAVLEKNDENEQDVNNKNSSNKLQRKKKMLVARPFVTMRGHTAFLTFASASIVPFSLSSTTATKQEQEATLATATTEA